VKMLYQTHAKVHLQNIRYNIEGIRKVVGPNKKILIPVKANAYGHGAVEVSRMAEKIGVDWLGIATVPEGIELRRAGILLPILKLNPVFAEEMDEAIANDLVLTVCEYGNARELDAMARRSGKKIPVHLKIDSGMGRIGVSMDDASRLAEDIEKKLPNLFLEGIYTHLPVSDELNRMFTERQISAFRTLVESIENRLGRKIPIVHCANSGAILSHPGSYLEMDMVRPGIMVYGFYPSHECPQNIPLKPGLSFFTRVSFLKFVTAGTSVGYGRSWIAPEDTWVATFPAGYADGFNRLFSNKGRVLIEGRSFPLVGRICMDQSMANLGSETNVRVGDRVVLIGNSGQETITAYEWAAMLNTITYEVTCQIGSRVPRLFDPYS